MTLLLSGLHGFVGSNLMLSLKDKYRIYGLDIVSPEKEGVVQTYSWNDIELAANPIEKLPKFDAIVHLAGKAHDTKNQSKAEEYFEINTGLTQKIFDFFLESTATKFIFFSSVKAAADTVDGDVLTENVIPAPVGPYGESKIAAENYILSKSNNLNLKSKQVYILRPCMIHGAGNKGNLNLLYNVVKKGIPWPLGAYENRRSFCCIDNIAFVVKELIERNNVPSGIYHIGDDTPLSTNELIELICESTNKKSSIWRIPKGFTNTMATIGTTLHLPLNKDRLRKLTENYVVSNAKIKEVLQIDEMPISSRDGMRKTLASFNNL